MSLYAIRGASRKVNHQLMTLSLKLAPSLVVDCANCANIHEFQTFSLGRFMKVFVVPAESLYRFQPTMNMLPTLASKLDVKRIFVTTFTKLFDYDDQEENFHIFLNVWERLKQLSKKFEVFVAIQENTIHDILAKRHKARFIKMGHTVWSQRITTDILLKELHHYGKALREDERTVYNQLLKDPLKHLGSISYTSSMHVGTFLLLSIILEQERKIQRLENEWKHGC